MCGSFYSGDLRCLFTPKVRELVPCLLRLEFHCLFDLTIKRGALVSDLFVLNVQSSYYVTVHTYFFRSVRKKTRYKSGFRKEKLWDNNHSKELLCVCFVLISSVTGSLSDSTFGLIPPQNVIQTHIHTNIPFS